MNRSSASNRTAYFVEGRYTPHVGSQRPGTSHEGPNISPARYRYIGIYQDPEFAVSHTPMPPKRFYFILVFLYQQGYIHKVKEAVPSPVRFMEEGS